VAVDGRWLMRPRPNPGAALRLFCFPFAGGGASVYRTWPADLPGSIEVCAVQPPGHESRLREEPLRRLAHLVAAAAEALAPGLDRPFAIFGHSLGALVAFELVRHLRRESMPMPVRLFVSGHQAPQLPDLRKHIHQLPDDEFVSELRRYNATPEEVLRNPELMELLTPVLRADFEALETYVYRPEPPLPCPLSAFGGVADPEVSAEQLAGWREQAGGPYTERRFPGSHFFVQTEQAAVLGAVAQDLGSPLPSPA
jgi:medium-chain acyl-[acyl-carrier-protein] hydrolase